MNDEFQLKKGLHFNSEMFKPPETGKTVEVVLSPKRPYRGRRIPFARCPNNKVYWLVEIKGE